MRQLNSDETWRQIPPEEKIELMAKAHSKGLLSAGMAILVGATLALALQLPWLLWAALLGAPLVFQFSAGKAWRALKPAAMLRFLAARSAARRYAYAARSKALNLNLLFRGWVEHIYGEGELEQKLEAMAAEVKACEVWVALFEDTVIMLTEQPGGAALEFSHSINSRLLVTSNDNGGYSADKEVYLSYRDKDDKPCRLKLTSAFPAALIVFEKEYQSLLAEHKGILDTKVQSMARNVTPDEDEDEEDPLDNLSMMGGDF